MSAEDLLRSLAVTARRLGPSVRPPGAAALLDSLTRTARVLFGAQACSLALVSADESQLEYVSTSGAGAESVFGMRIPSGQGIAGFVAATGQAVAIGDPRRDPRFAADVAAVTGYVPRAMLVVPVRSPDRLIGVLTLLDRDTTRPDADRDLERLSLFADQAALAVEAVRAFEDVGSVLLRALADAACSDDPDLVRALTALPPEDDASDELAEVAEVAEVLAALEQAGPAERRLAVGLLRDVLRYARDRAA